MTERNVYFCPLVAREDLCGSHTVTCRLHCESAVRELPHHSEVFLSRLLSFLLARHRVTVKNNQRLDHRVDGGDNGDDDADGGDSGDSGDDGGDSGDDDADGGDSGDDDADGDSADAVFLTTIATLQVLPSADTSSNSSPILS